MEKFLKQLEFIKQIGAYDLNITIGGGAGCDDLGEPMLKRPISILYMAVGCLGEARILWKGTVTKFMKTNFAKIKPKKISNPPKSEQYKNQGFYIWGTDDGVKHALELRQKIIAKGVRT